MVFNYDQEMSLTDFYAGAKHAYRLVMALLYEENLDALKPVCDLYACIRICVCLYI